MIQLPIESYQLMDGVSCRWTDLLATQVRVNLCPSSKEVDNSEVEIATDSALSGSTVCLREQNFNFDSVIMYTCTN